jgi:putative transposase
MMPVVDECTRECLALEVECSITAEEEVIHHPGASVRGARRTTLRPFGQRTRVRGDGAQGVAEGFRGGDAVHREAGSPWENAYAESFIGRLGDELLKREVFTGLLVEAKVSVEECTASTTTSGERTAPWATANAFGVRGLVVRSGGRAGGTELTKELQSATTLS